MCTVYNKCVSIGEVRVQLCTYLCLLLGHAIRDTCSLPKEGMVPVSGFCPVTFDLLPTLLRGPLPRRLPG